MTIKELKEKIKLYDDDVRIQTEIIIMDEDSNIIDKTQEDVVGIKFEDNLGETEDMFYIKTYYTLTSEAIKDVS